MLAEYPDWTSLSVAGVFLARDLILELAGRILPRATLSPQRRFGQVADLEGVLLLLSAPAGGYMTGEIVTIDGGLNLSGM